MHDATIAILLVISIDVQHQSKLLHCRTQIYRFLLTSAELKSNEVAFAICPFMVESVSCLFSTKRSRMDPQFQNLLPELIKEQIAEILHFFVYITLPFEALGRRLRENVQFDEVFIAGEETKTFEELSPGE